MHKGQGNFLVLLLAYSVVAQKVNKYKLNNAGDKPRAMRGRAGSTGNDLDAPAHMDPKVRRAGPLIPLDMGSIL